MLWGVFDVVGVGGGWHVLVFLGVCGGFVLYIQFSICLVYGVLDMVQQVVCDMMVYKREVWHSLMRVVLLWRVYDSSV